MRAADCIARAHNAYSLARVSAERARLMSGLYGPQCDEARAHAEEAAAAEEAAEHWRALAHLHPQTRAALIRRGLAPH